MVVKVFSKTKNWFTFIVNCYMTEQVLTPIVSKKKYFSGKLNLLKRASFLLLTEESGIILVVI